jgi:hypothetical protein
MSNFTNVRVQVGPSLPAQPASISYGPVQSGVTTLKQMTDLDFPDAVNGGSIVYNATSNSFFIKAVAGLDNGFF